MSSLLLVGLKIGFLVLLWLFILFVTNVIRVDLFGRRVNLAELGTAAPSQAATNSQQIWPSRITITQGNDAGSQAKLPTTGNEIYIGRAATCQLVVEDDYASGQHARIWQDEYGFIIEDLLSTNGTYVNEAQIDQPTRITSVDMIRVGRTQMRLEA